MLLSVVELPLMEHFKASGRKEECRRKGGHVFSMRQTRWLGVFSVVSAS